MRSRVEWPEVALSPAWQATTNKKVTVRETSSVKIPIIHSSQRCIIPTKICIYYKWKHFKLKINAYLSANQTCFHVIALWLFFLFSWIDVEKKKKKQIQIFLTQLQHVFCNTKVGEFPSHCLVQIFNNHWEINHRTRHYTVHSTTIHYFLKTKPTTAIKGLSIKYKLWHHLHLCSGNLLACYRINAWMHSSSCGPCD